MPEPLDVLIADGVIDEVLGRLKSGKEANISLVRRGELVCAAKVYKDRATRSFKNNSEYKEGRKVRNSRTQRAMDGGGRFGREAAEQAWKSAEADALYKLADSGVRVPAPLMFYEGVLLMELVRDANGQPAPRLIEIAIERDAALGIYADLCAQLIAMLCCDLIHGDLSPYNILAAADGPTIIDFPQVISAVHNSRAEFFFLRDFDNIVRFLAGFDPSLAVHAADGRAIWQAYVRRDLSPQFVPPPPPPPRAARGFDRGARRDDRGRPPPRDDRRGRQGNGSGPPRGPQRSGPPRSGPPRSDPPRSGPPPRDPRPGYRADQRPPWQATQRSHQGPRPDDRVAGASGRSESAAHQATPPRRAPEPGPPRWSPGPSAPAPSPSRGRRRRPKRRW